MRQSRAVTSLEEAGIGRGKGVVQDARDESSGIAGHARHRESDTKTTPRGGNQGEPSLFPNGQTVPDLFERVVVVGQARVLVGDFGELLFELLNVAAEFEDKIPVFLVQVVGDGEVAQDHSGGSHYVSCLTNRDVGDLGVFPKVRNCRLFGGFGRLAEDLQGVELFIGQVPKSCSAVDRCVRQDGAGDIRSVEICIMQVGSTEVSPLEFPSQERGSSEIGIDELGVGENGVHKICGVEICTGEIGTVTGSFDKIGAFQISFAKICSDKIGLAELGINEGSALEVGAVENGFAEIRFFEFGAAEIGVHEISCVEICAAKVSIPEIGTAEVDILAAHRPPDIPAVDAALRNHPKLCFVCDRASPIQGNFRYFHWLRQPRGVTVADQISLRLSPESGDHA